MLLVLSVRVITAGQTGVLVAESTADGDHLCLVLRVFESIDAVISLIWPYSYNVDLYEYTFVTKCQSGTGITRLKAWHPSSDPPEEERLSRQPKSGSESRSTLNLKSVNCIKQAILISCYGIIMAAT